MLPSAPLDVGEQAALLEGEAGEGARPGRDLVPLENQVELLPGGGRLLAAALRLLVDRLEALGDRSAVAPAEGLGDIAGDSLALGPDLLGEFRQLLAEGGEGQRPSLAGVLGAVGGNEEGDDAGQLDPLEQLLALNQRVDARGVGAAHHLAGEAIGRPAMKAPAPSAASRVDAIRPTARCWRG